SSPTSGPSSELRSWRPLRPSMAGAARVSVGTPNPLTLPNVRGLGGGILPLSWRVLRPVAAQPIGHSADSPFGWRIGVAAWRAGAYGGVKWRTGEGAGVHEGAA